MFTTSIMIVIEIATVISLLFVIDLFSRDIKKWFKSRKSNALSTHYGSKTDILYPGNPLACYFDRFYYLGSFAGNDMYVLFDNTIKMSIRQLIAVNSDNPDHHISNIQFLSPIHNPLHVKMLSRTAIVKSQLLEKRGKVK